MSNYVYHPFHEPVIVDDMEYPKYLNTGWYDSPAKFPQNPVKVSDEINEPELGSVKKKGRPPKQKIEHALDSVA